MPFQFDFRDGLVRIKLYGAISLEDLRQLTDQSNRFDATAGQVHDRIVDVSETGSFSLNMSLIRDLATDQKGVKFRNPFKAAIVAPTLEQYGLSRMYQICNQNPAVTIMVFKDTDSAHQWLGRR